MNSKGGNICKISPGDVKEIIEGVKKSLREKEEKRIKSGSRRPEEPGLTPEARHFMINY